MPPAHAHRRGGPWLLGSPARRARRDEVWVAERDGELARLRDVSTPTGSTASTSAPTLTGQGIGCAAARPGRGDPRPTASRCGSSRATPARGASTRGTAWSSSSAPTAPATRSGPPTSGWPGRARPAGVLPRPGRRGRRSSSATCWPAGCALTRAVQPHKATATGDPAREQPRSRRQPTARRRGPTRRRSTREQDHGGIWRAVRSSTDPEPTIEQYADNDLVSHDSYGMRTGHPAGSGRRDGRLRVPDGPRRQPILQDVQALACDDLSSSRA